MIITVKNAQKCLINVHNALTREQIYLLVGVRRVFRMILRLLFVKNVIIIAKYVVKFLTIVLNVQKIE